MRNLFIYLLLLIASSLMAQNQTVYATKLYVNGKLVNKVSDDPTTITDEETATLPSAAAVQSALDALPVGIDSVVYDTGTFAYYSKGTLINTLTITLDDLGGVEADEVVLDSAKYYADSIATSIEDALIPTIYQPRHAFKNGDPVAAVDNYYTFSDGNFTGRHDGIVQVISEDYFRLITSGTVKIENHGFTDGETYYVNGYGLSTSPGLIEIPAFTVLDSVTLNVIDKAGIGSASIMNPAGGNLRFYGNSITIGQSASPQEDNRWSALLSDAFLANEQNGGIGGTTVQNTVNSVTGVTRVDNFIDRIASGVVPVWDSPLDYVFVGYVTNDFRSDVGGNMTAQTFSADYRQCIDSLIQARNYPPENIVLVTDYWLTIPDAYEKTIDVGLTNVAADLDRQNEFRDSIRAIANSYGLRLVDPRSAQSKNGGDETTADGVHPTNEGHALIAGAFYDQLTELGSVTPDFNSLYSSVVDTIVRFTYPDTKTVVGDTVQGYQLYNAAPVIVERNGERYLQILDDDIEDFIYLSDALPVNVVELTNAGLFHPDSNITIKTTFDRVNANSRAGIIMGGEGHPSSVGPMLVFWGNDLRLYRNNISNNLLLKTETGVLTTDTEHEIEWRKIGADSMSVYVDGVLSLEHKHTSSYMNFPGKILLIGNIGNNGDEAYFKDFEVVKNANVSGSLMALKHGNVLPNVEYGGVAFNFEGDMKWQRVYNVGEPTKPEDAVRLQDVTPITDRLKWGSGSPEGVVTADPGTMYLNLTGGASTTLYVKEAGTGNTGWAAK